MMAPTVFFVLRHLTIFNLAIFIENSKIKQIKFIKRTLYMTAFITKLI